jgi:hypothetical protein
MLFFAMMSIMFTKHSRFADLKRKLDVVKTKKSKLITILVLMISMTGFAQTHNHEHDENVNMPIILKMGIIPELHQLKTNWILY